MLASCADPDSAPLDSTHCLALVNAVDMAEFLALSDEERNAIVAIRFASLEPEMGGVICSAIVVSSTKALTAAHCVQREEAFPLEVVIGPTLSCPTTALPASVEAVHTELDLAIVEIPGLSGNLSVEPIGILEDAVDSSWIGKPFQLAGFGSDGVDPPEHRRFLVENVVEVAPEHIVVDGLGRSGACVAIPAGRS